LIQKTRKTGEGRGARLAHMSDSPTLAYPPRIDMVAIAATANIRRHYHISWTRDLFDHFIVDLHWGRIGTRGQTKSTSFADNNAATKFIASVLKKRASAQKRIGVPYQIL
jgi:predicted DNA-binding WGR domain protein